MKLNNNKDENTFLEPKTILAIILVAVVFFGWQMYLGKKYPQSQKPQLSTTAPTTSDSAVTAAEPHPAAPGVTTPTALPAQAREEKLTSYASDNIAFDFSSQGMSLKNVVLKHYSTRQKEPVTFANGKGSLFETVLVGLDKQPNFEITEVSPNTFFGKATVGDMSIEKTVQIDPVNYKLATTVKISKIDAKLEGIGVLTAERKHPRVESSIINPSYESQDFVVGHSGSIDRVNIISSKENIDKKIQGVSLTALGSQYFTTAVLDKSDIYPDVTLTADVTGELATMLSVYRLTSKMDSLQLNYIAYAGPKSKSVFENVDRELISIIDFGMFGAIGKVLLEVLKWFHGIVGNWGLAIILLTLLVRGLVAPLNISSYKSMKKMQKISPLMASLRAKHKEDPTTLNKEMMALMKEHKVNPLGGCLPMVVQMPVFFALYQVLKSSIELYQAPFFGWITDLSMKDPFFILPAIMGVSMFVQQKITPNTMDPAQAKIMQFLPIVFSLMMISLPSGLTLYIAVSTIFGIIQQQIFTRDSNAKGEKYVRTV